MLTQVPAKEWPEWQQGLVGALNPIRGDAGGLRWSLHSEWLQHRRGAPSRGGGACVVGACKQGVLYLPGDVTLSLKAAHGQPKLEKRPR